MRMASRGLPGSAGRHAPRLNCLCRDFKFRTLRMKTTHPKSPKPKGGGKSVTARRDGLLTRILIRAILVAGCCALFLPVIVNGSFYYSFIFLKSILFRATVQIMVACYVVLAVMSPRYRPRLNLISYALMAWFGVMLISSLPGVSVDPWSSWLGDFRRMGGMLAQLHLLAFFVVLSQTLKRERDWLTMFVASLFSAVLMGFSGMLEYLQLNYLYRFPQESRIEGAAGNPNFFAATMLLGFFVVFLILANKDKPADYPFLAKVWLCLLAGVDLFAIGWDLIAGGNITSGLGLFPVAVFVLVLHGISFAWFIMRRSIPAGMTVLVLIAGWCFFWMYQTQTRSAVVGLLGALILLAGIYLSFGASRKMRLAGGSLMLMLVLVSAVIWINRNSPFMESHPILRRYASLSFSDASSAGRISAWRASARAVADRPLLGWGVENYRNAFDRHFPQEIYTSASAEVWFDRAHNWIMDIGTTTGVIGLATFGAFYGIVLLSLFKRWLRRRDEAVTLVLMAFMLAYLIMSLFTFDTINTDIILYSVMAYIAYRSVHGKPAAGIASEARTGPRKILGHQWVLIGIAAVLLAAAMSFGVIRPYESNRLLQQARISTKVLNPDTGRPQVTYRDETLNLFRRADSYNTTGQHAIHEEFANYAFELSKAPYVPIGEKLAVVEQAATFLQESVKRSPANARYYQYMASLVNGTFDIVNPANPQLATSLAELALAGMQRAEPLSPTRPQWYFEKSQLLFSLGRTDERVAAWEKGLTLCTALKDPHVKMVAIYVSSGRDDDAAREWQDIRARGFVLNRADYDQVIDSYLARKKLEPVVELYKEELAVTPGDGDLMARLATAYRDLGEEDLARETAIRAAAQSPALAAGLQTFLDRLKGPRSGVSTPKVPTTKRQKTSTQQL